MALIVAHLGERVFVHPFSHMHVGAPVAACAYLGHFGNDDLFARQSDKSLTRTRISTLRASSESDVRFSKSEDDTNQVCMY